MEPGAASPESAARIARRKVERVTKHEPLVSTDEVEARLAGAGLEPRWTGSPPAGFAAVTQDSRRVEPESLFCAVPGLTVDGHAFVGEAEAAGAAAAVVEREVAGAGLPQLVVADARTALAHLAALFHGDPGRTVELTAVTGTDGKTTTAWILRHLLAEAAPSAAMGTLGVVGPEGERRPGDLTTPGPVETCRRLAALRDHGVRHVAMEVSSHALDQRRVDGLRFAAVVLTNLSREHLDYHRDMEAYRDAKLRALDLLRPGGAPVINADEPAWAGADVADAVTYGRSPGADVRAREVRREEGGSRWILSAGGEEAEVRLPLPGDFNVHNALAASAAALAAGRPLGAVARRLGEVPQVPGRMEVLSRGPCLVVRDYAHTPDALRRALAQLRPASGRLIVVFGCGGDRDRGKRPLMGRAAAGAADLAVVTADNPRSEDPAEIARQVVEGIERARGEGADGRHEVVLDRREAIARALEVAGPADVVLLAGKGHEDYQQYGEERVPFDEAEIVRELTSGEAPA